MELKDLPDEILQHIISKIPLNSELAKVVLVSHRFKTLTEPILYRNIHLDAEPLEECRLGVLPTLKRTDQLIANLKSRPELGRYTTAFSLRVTHPLWYQSYPQISITRRMPELRQLSYDPPAVHGGSLPAECEDLTDLRLDFSHVTKHYDDESTSWLEDGVPLEIIAKHLWHPSLRKLQAEKVFFTRGFGYESCLIQRRMRNGRSLVDDLRFLNCVPHIQYHALCAFITSLRRLKCFVLETKWPTQSLTAPNDPPPSTIDLRTVLAAHHTTIEELALSSSDHALDLVQVSGSFIKWTALKRLAVPYPRDLFHHAMLHQFLPPQLEELQLEEKLCTCSAHEVSIHHEIMPQNDISLLWQLAEKKRVLVPGLKRLIWWFQYPSGQNVVDGGNRLHMSTVELLGQQHFENAGVKFEVVATPFFKQTPFGKRLYEW